jgi:putative ABC transport system permease protein
LRFHLDLDAMQERDVGRARRRFGNLTWYREEMRRIAGIPVLDVLRQDAASAWRANLRSPATTLLIIGLLALGVGANAAAFVVLDRLYLRPPDGLSEPFGVRRIWVEYTRTGDGVPFTDQPMSYPVYQAIAAASGDSTRLAVFEMEDGVRFGAGRAVRRIHAVYASAGYFPVLGVRSALGRFYSADEDRFGSAAPVVVVSDAFWRRELGGDALALGRTVLLDGHPLTVIGVAAAGFAGLDLQPADVWLPFAAQKQPRWMKEPWWESGQMTSFRAVWRPAAAGAEGAFEARATQLVRQTNRRTSPTYPDTLMRVYAGSIISARGPGRPGQELVIASRLSAVTGIVLLIACANVINLLLARAVTRRREIAVRLALGVSRGRLARLFVMEGLLLASAAAAAALVVGWWTGALLRAALMPDIAWRTPALDGRVVAFTVVIALGAGLIAGIVPAPQTGHPDLTTALKGGWRDPLSHPGRLRRALAATQAALSVVLLVGAALFVRSLRNVEGVDLGYDTDRLVFAGVTFEEGATPTAAVADAKLRDVADAIAHLPGVESVARAAIEPMWGFSTTRFFIGADSESSFPGREPTFSSVSPEYFRTTGLGILRGRTFAAGGQEVVVNDAMAALYWRGRDPIGECIHPSTRQGPCYAVVGVVANAHRDRVIEGEPAPMFYLNPQSLGNGTVIVRVRTARDIGRVAPEIRRALIASFPAGDPWVHAMTDELARQYRPWRLGASLFSALGVLALIVAVVGIYSTTAYGVSQRTHEFGIRAALGARLGDVLRLVVGEGIRTVVLGVLVGVGLALAAGQLVSSMLYGIAPDDPATMAAASAVLLAVSVLAALFPAWRAARVEPVEALRAE